MFDVDGTVGNFHKAFTKIARRKLGKHHTYEQSISARRAEVGLGLTREDTIKIYKEVWSPRFANTLEPIDGAVEVIKGLHESGEHEVFFVTTPAEQSETWVWDRNKWLRRVFGSNLGSRYAYTSYKFIVDGDILVEDTPSVLEEWISDARARGRPSHGLLYSWPYNADSNLPRFDKWSDFLGVVQKIIDPGVPSPCQSLGQNTDKPRY